jgi:hypothetical protein
MGRIKNSLMVSLALRSAGVGLWLALLLMGGLSAFAAEGHGTPEKTDKDCIEAGFDLLASFEYGKPVDEDWPAGVTSEVKAYKHEIPAQIKSLNGRRVRVTGFMLPLEMENGLATDFLIMKSQTLCCYGVYPRENEWVSVHMTGRGMRAVMDVPVSVEGELHVGTQPGQEGIYRMIGAATPSSHGLSLFLYLGLGLFAVVVGIWTRDEIREACQRLFRNRSDSRTRITSYWQGKGKLT